MAMSPARGMATSFTINAKSFDMSRIDIETKAGQVELWADPQPTHMDHPFHIHGKQFRGVEIEREGRVAKPAFPRWKDTTNVTHSGVVRLPLLHELAPTPK